MDGLVSKSYRFGHRYDGRDHGLYASSIKKYTSASKRPLNRAEQSQLMRLLQNFTATRSWNWLSLTTTLHSLTSAGVFTLHKPVDQRVKRAQAALLSTLLDAIIFKCNRKATAWEIDARGIANLLWAMAKLVDNGQEQTPALNEAVAALLPCVKTQKANFRSREISNLLWAMAKLVDFGLERTPGFTETMTALLPHVNAHKDQFIPQHTANLLWAIAKLVDNGQQWTPGLKESVAALLPHVNAQKDQFNAQGNANLLWAMAKLVDNGQEQTPGLKEVVAALLPHVNAKKDQLNARDIASLLWAMAKLGELVELNVVKSTSELLLYQISQCPQLSQQDISMSLWGVLVCCARLSSNANADKNSLLEKHMDALFTRLENATSNNGDEQSIIAMATSWLGRACPIVPHYQTSISKPQTDFRDQLQLSIPTLKIEAERSLNSLPPVDLLLPDHNIIIEIQGPSHYVWGDFKTRNGSTLLKIALLQKAGFEVIEIPTNTLWNQDSIKRCIDQIKTRVDIPPQGHGSVSYKIGWADEANVTVDKGCQSSDYCYLTAEEHLEKQTGKPTKRKRKRKKKPITSSLSS
ncbi:RAP domain-containing protein [Thalassotalea sp. G20_0]|uniref:RAP domain-containing protein n=1 Tax=Thalassotalea sp. G20_0 TaxID=2821093 RepID=UPI001ADB9261|nr:RAP domain-containing protein [Thalassotalea sp. G20_0]